jgi:hypothetical protein
MPNFNFASSFLKVSFYTTRLMVSTNTYHINGEEHFRVLYK